MATSLNDLRLAFEDLDEAESSLARAKARKAALQTDLSVINSEIPALQAALVTAKASLKARLDDYQ